jgi:tRNA pseudouridine55 synthase
VNRTVTIPTGVLVLDKPAGLSSSKALEPLRRAVGRKGKVGHAGTLDPFATGVLLALLGDATRLSDLAMALPKRYRARVRFGRRTDTLDPEGAVVEEVDPGSTAPSRLEEALAGFVGEIEQLPPAYSALKVDGRRAYKLAREGREVDLKPRRVRIDRCDLLETTWPEIEIDIQCGAGTYVRAIARDLGEAVDLPGMLVALRRTAIGPFEAGEGLAPDAIDFDRVRPAIQVCESVGLLTVPATDPDALRFVSGRAIRAPEGTGRGMCAVSTPSLLLGLGEVGSDGTVRPFRVFGSARETIEGRS